MPKTSFVLTALVLYWLYLWRTHRKGGTAPPVTLSGGTLPPLKTFPPGTVPRLPFAHDVPSLFGPLPFGTPGINGRPA